MKKLLVNHYKAFPIDKVYYNGVMDITENSIAELNKKLRGYLYSRQFGSVDSAAGTTVPKVVITDILEFTTKTARIAFQFVGLSNEDKAYLKDFSITQALVISVPEEEERVCE